jgi:hypothetical protein
LSLARRAFVACLLAAGVPAAQADAAKTSASAPAETAPVAASAGKPAPAQPAATAPDDELLEFLGSVDSEGGDEAWLEYLSQADIGRVARGRKPATATPEGDQK